VTSRHLDERRMRGLLKLGDVVIPGDERMPSFSRSGCAAHADRMLDFMSPRDGDGVKGLLALVAILPRPLVSGLLRLLALLRRIPGRAGAPFRMAEIGIKGVVMSLYYSGVGESADVLGALGWRANVVERER
jgi:hypothetical protein